MVGSTEQRSYPGPQSHAAPQSDVDGVKQAAVGASVEHPDPGMGADVRGPFRLVFRPRPGEIELVEPTPHAIGHHGVDHEMTGSTVFVPLVHGELEHEIAPAMGEPEMGRHRLAFELEEIE